MACSDGFVSEILECLLRAGVAGNGHQVRFSVARHGRADFAWVQAHDVEFRVFRGECAREHIHESLRAAIDVEEHAREHACERADIHNRGFQASS